MAGRYKLGDDFYVPGTTLNLVACGDGLCERQKDGRLVGLLREKNDVFVHRSSWGRIRFHFDAEGKATGLRFYDQFEAVRLSD
ncbi:MAG: hypothetical protein M3041_09500 [Acidobacteriota bacterium]|nr:hypothetical protein [Acidobacteriota bacterium]